MKTTYVVILTVLLLLVSACAQKVNDPADVQAIKKSMDDFPNAFCRRNDRSLQRKPRTHSGRSHF